MADVPLLIELMTDGIAGNRAALVLGDGVDRAVVAGGGNFQAAVDGGLGLVQLALGGGEVLQRDQGAGVGVDAKRHLVSPFWCVEHMLLGVLPASTYWQAPCRTGFRFA